MSAELMIGSDLAVALQASIQKELAVKGYSDEDDTVMAEYITIMLINNKSPEQVTGELTELVGGEYDPKFTEWLFQEKSNPALLGSTDAQLPPINPTASAAPPKDIPTVSDDRRTSLNQSRSQRPLHQQAISSLSHQNASPGGTKRQRSASPSSNGPAKRRQADLPDRPRAMRDDAPRGGRSNLLDRLGPRQNNNNNNNNGPDHIQDRIRNITLGQPGNNNPNMNPSMMGQGFPPGMDPQTMAMMQQQGFNPAMMGQAIPGSFEGAMMAIQQFGQLAMQMGLVPGPMGMGAPPGMMPNGQQGGGFNGGMGGRGGFQGDRGGRRGGRQPGGPGRGAPNGQGVDGGSATIAPAAQPVQPPVIVAPTPVQISAPVPANIPQRPISPTLCKFVTNCNNPTCRYSHPSPVATMESGVVLSTDPCEKGVDCDDKDCIKAHVSKAAKNPSAAPTTVAAAPVPAAPQPSHVSQIPCKFDPHCTRVNCPYYHPSAKYKAKSNTPCRFGAACTRADCTFSHPAGRVLPGQFSKGLNATAPTFVPNGKPGADSKNKTVDFRAAKSGSTPAQKEDGEAPAAAVATPAVDAVSGA